MDFPDINAFPKCFPGPYERGMGTTIANLLRVFAEVAPDKESNRRVLELAETPGQWSAGHAVFDAVRTRLLASQADTIRQWQHTFEESCCQAMYNASDPREPFDPGSTFFVFPHAIHFARALGMSDYAVTSVLTSLGDG